MMHVIIAPHAATICQSPSAFKRYDPLLQRSPPHFDGCRFLAPVNTFRNQSRRRSTKRRCDSCYSSQLISNTCNLNHNRSQSKRPKFNSFIQSPPTSNYILSCQEQRFTFRTQFWTSKSRSVSGIIMIQDLQQWSDSRDVSVAWGILLYLMDIRLRVLANRLCYTDVRFQLC